MQPETKIVRIMTAIQMNAELFRQLSIIAEDESLSAKLMKYIKKLTAQKQDSTLMTKEEFFRRVDEAKKGPLYELRPGETLDDLIKRAV